MNRNNNHCWLLKKSCLAMKYLLLGTAGFGLAWIAGTIFSLPIVNGLLMVWEGLWRLAIAVFCCFGVAVVAESLQ